MDQASPRNLSNTTRSSADDVRLIADMRWLGALAERLVQDPGLAEDACQDAWLHAIRTEGAAPDRTLLFRSVRRVLYRYWRGARRRSARERQVAPPEAQPAASDWVERQEQRHRIWSALLELEEPYRATLLLRFQEDLSTEAIAERLGVASDTVRWRLRQGTDRLRRRLGDDGDPGGLKALVAAVPPALGPASGTSLHASCGAGSSTLFPHLPFGTLTFLKWTGALLMTKLFLGLTLVVAAAFLVLFQRNGDNARPIAVVAERGAASVPAAIGRELERPAAPMRQLVDDPPTLSEHEQILAALRAQPIEPFDAPIVRLLLETSDGSPLPGTVDVVVTGFVGDSHVPGRRIEARTSVTSGAGDVPLVSEGLVYGPDDSPGVVEVAAAGFGRQRSEFVRIAWTEGAVTEVPMVLKPSTSVDLMVVHEGTEDRVEELLFGLSGPSAHFGDRYRPRADSVVTLHLWPTDQPEDLVFIRGEGVALGTWTVAEIRALPVDPDGVRHLEAPAGATVRGTVTMESGLPIPAGVELHYTMRGPAGTPARVFPIGMEPEGSAPIAVDGAFVISGLPAGLLVTHMREKSRSLRATPTSPDHLVEVPSSGEVLTRVVIPASPTVVTLNVSWGDRIDLLLFADLYRLNDDYDGPYAERPAPRELVAQRHWMLSGEESPLLFAPGALEDGQPYLLRIGLDVDRRIERLITFHGEAPRLDHTFTEAAMAEHPPSNQGPPSTAADDYRRRAAREVGAHITLRATTP